MSILKGIRVLDVASYLAAPVAGTMLADFGADVIKVEPPHGDPYRRLNENPGMPQANVDFHWQVTNRNKRGITLDLQTDAGRSILNRLIGKTDILITNFTPPARKKLGLRYADVAPLNDRLIYASMTAYGESGPEATKTGFDSTAYWARSGLMHMVRPEPTAVPARSLPGQGDHPTGVALFGAITLGLLQRERTGKGTMVHSSLIANGVWSNGYFAQSVLSGGNAPMRPQRDQMPNALTNHYRCKDHHWFILSIVNQDREWPSLTEAIGRPELREDSRFNTREARTRNVQLLTELLDEVFASESWSEWQGRLDAHRITFGTVGMTEDIPSDPQMVASGAIRAADDPRIGASYVVDTPMWVEGVQKAPAQAAPLLGADNDAVLTEAGFTDEQIKTLRSQGAFGDAET